MPIEAQWISLAVACLGLCLGIINAAVIYWRGRRHIQLDASFDEPTQSGARLLRIEIVNAGGVTIWVKKVFIAGHKPAVKQIGVIENTGRRCNWPIRLEPGAVFTWISAGAAFDEPFMRHAYGVGAQLTDGKCFVAKLPLFIDNALKVKAAMVRRKTAGTATPVGIQPEEDKTIDE